MPEKRKFLPPTLSEWAKDVESDEDPTWIIQGFLPRDNLLLCSGEPKNARKTFFSMLTAMVAATGKPVGPLRCETPVPVLYICREGPRRSTLQRMKALAAGNGLGNIHDMKNLFFHHREDFFLDKPEQVASACAFVREHGIKVIYIDTFAKSITSDENSSKDMGIAVGSADKLRAAGATVVLVHHVAKRSPTLTGGRSGYPDPDKDLRGSSALSGAYETHWAVRCYPTEDSKERDWVMLVGGKDVEQTAYIYDWKFENRRDENDEEFLASVKLVLEPLGTAMHIDAPKEAKGKHLRVVEENF